MSNTDNKPTVCLISLGCPKNLVDSEKILAELAQGGCIVGAPIDDADAIVINTCGFIEAARTEAMEVIGEALAHKRSGRAKRVIVAGCLPSRDGPDLHDELPEVDAVVGVANRGQVIQAVLASGRFTMVDPCTGRAPDDSGRFRLTARHTAYLRIAEGCSRGCTYCTIPAIRGPLRSKNPEKVLAEARELISDDAIELNVIAQDTTAYGDDLGEGADLASLLTDLDNLEGVRWIRLMYTYPRRFTDELIETVASCRHVVPYVDMPLQHISDPVLKRMGRRVRRDHIEKLLASLRSRIPGIALRTTFIVGFPGETERQFSELLAFVENACFDALGVFEFSPERGTPAATMPDQLPGEVKSQRAEQIMLAQQQIAFQANARAVGSEIAVLVDGMDASGRCVGRHVGQAPDIDSVCMLTEPIPAGSFVSCRVVDFADYDLIVSPGWLSRQPKRE